MGDNKSGEIEGGQRKKTFKRRLQYKVKDRIRFIIKQINKYGSPEKAAPHILSEYTGKPMRGSSVRSYLNDHGFTVARRTYQLTDLEGNLIDLKTMKPIKKEEIEND